MNEDKDLWFRVTFDIRDTPRNHLEYGYECATDFRKALRRLNTLYSGKVGRQIGQRRGFCQLRFENMDGKIEKTWLPAFMLEQAAPPRAAKHNCDDFQLEPELRNVFGPGW